MISEKYDVLTAEGNVYIPVTRNKAINLNEAITQSQMLNKDLVITSGKTKLTFRNFPNKALKLLKSQGELSVIDVESYKDIHSFNLKGMELIAVGK